MSTQIRLRSSVAGTNQQRLEDWIEAVNDFMGQEGNQWNNTGGGGRWDAATAFDGFLEPVQGQDLTAILQRIDELDTSDSHFANANLTATGDRTHSFGNNDLTINGLGSAGLTIWAFGDASQITTEYFSINRLSDTSKSGELRLHQNLSDGLGYVGIRGPQTEDLTSTYTLELPSSPPGSNGEVLEVVSGGGTNAPRLQWAAGGSDTNFANTDLTSGGNRLHEFGGTSLTIQNATTMTLDASTSMTLNGGANSFYNANVHTFASENSSAARSASTQRSFDQRVELRRYFGCFRDFDRLQHDAP